MLEIKLREHLNEWRFWMVIAYIGLVGVLLSVIYVNSQTSKATARVARDEAVHQSEIDTSKKTAAAKLAADKQRCLDSIPQLIKINNFAASLKTFGETLVQNSKATLDSTSMSDSLYELRLRNFYRLQSALPAIEAVHFPVPTKKQCNAVGKGG